MFYFDFCPNRQSYRLKGYDYSKNGLYFVTICTKYGRDFFGEVKNGIMGLSDIGCVAAKFWQEIPNHFSFVRLDEWIAMPNHFHGVLEINNPNPVGTRDLASVQRKFGALQRNSLSLIIQSFKAAVKRWCNKNGYEDFLWHVKFHDHVIRDKESLNRVRKYIQDNPVQWELDVENLKNQFDANKIKNHYDRLFDK
ncbi:transposase [Patescibacteria group bacterium]|nr:transposase [Patescibacteria group bacterium]MBU1683454.1 transposase [Patescibacteria group bacterium]MBU1934821.1 transposase [Patescibacteria group bacterium]